MATDLSPVMVESDRFTGFVGDDDSLTKAEFQRARAKNYAAVLITLLVLDSIVAAVLVCVAHKPPPTIGFASGYLFKAELKPGVFQVEDYLTQYRDTIETLFRRTEKGSLPQMREFVEPGVREFVDKRYTQVTSNYPAGFVQNFSVAEERKVGFYPAEGMKMMYRGTLTIRSAQRMETTVLYLAATFSIGQRTALNSTGWRLAELRPISEDAYYATERQAEREQRLELKSNAAKPAGGP